MYFNGIYSVDTQVSLFVCLKYGRVCHFFLNFLENEAHKVLCRDEDTQVYIRKALSVRPSIHPSIRPSHFCRKHISKNIEVNVMKLDTLIEGHDENCRIQEL